MRSYILGDENQKVCKPTSAVSSSSMDNEVRAEDRTFLQSYNKLTTLPHLSTFPRQ